MRKEFYFILFTMITGCVMAFKPSTDSSVVSKPTKKNTHTLTLRMNSIGLFAYMGKVVNYHPAVDLLYTYKTRNNFGFSLFKVTDVVDSHSGNNFTIAFVNITFHIGERLSVAPNIGVNMEQQHSIVDHGSDLIALLNTSFRLNKNVVIDHSAMFPNIAFEQKYSDWINRFRILYSKRHLDVTGMFWHNNSWIDNANHFSMGTSIFYNRMRLREKVKCGGGVTSLWTVGSSNTEKVPKRLGIQFTASLTIN